LNCNFDLCILNFELTKNMKHKINFQTVVTNFIIFLLFVYPPSDYDFGWHLRYGQFFWENGRLLRDNILSYTMPFYHWVNHSWLYDLWFYPFFKIFGFLGVAILGPLIMFFAVKILFRAIKASNPEQIMGAFLLSFLGSHSLNEGLRSRYPIFIFLALLYFFLTKIKEGRKSYLYFLPLLLFIGANLHGQFSIGLLYLFLVWIVMTYDAFKNPKKNFRNWIMLAITGLISGAITIVNPFGAQIFGEALKHAVNPNLTLVVEYFPPDLTSIYGIGLIIYTTAIICSLFFFRNPEFLKEALPLIPFAYMAFSARRNIIFFIIFSAPLFFKMLHPYFERLSKDIPLRPPRPASTRGELGEAGSEASNFQKISALLISGFFVILVFRLVPFNLLSYDWNAYCNFSSGCSEGATKYLTKNVPKGLGFTYYDWGGYLTWRFPQKKTFIDGRMHLWQIQNHYIMQEHEKLITASGDWETLFRDFDFSWALLPVNSNLAGKIELLVQNGLWEKVFQDDKAVIYVRMIPKPK